MSRAVYQDSAVDKALRAITAELGSEAVSTDEAAIGEYRDPFWFRGSTSHDAIATVMPTSTAQVQAVVRIANEHEVPLWVVSQGRNMGYGGGSARIAGSILVSLRNMNRVLDIDDDLAYAVVEPGVTFYDLYSALEERGGGLWASLPDLGWGSVMGNALDHGQGVMPSGDHAVNLCGLEVVLPTGELLRTGMGALSGSKVAHAYGHSFGPDIEGLFTQSSLGIVTRVGVRLMPRPDRILCVMANFDGDRLIAPVVDAFRKLMLSGVIAGMPMMAQGVGMDDETKGVLDPDASVWSVRFALYGSEERVQGDFRSVEVALGNIEGVTLTHYVLDGHDRPSHDANHDDRVRCSVPDMDFWKMFQDFAFGENTAHLDLSPVGPMIGADVQHAVGLIRSLYADSPLPLLWGIVLQGRAVIYITANVFDVTDDDQVRAVYQAYNDRVSKLAEAGYPIYRTNIHHMDHVAQQFDYNNHAYRRFNEALKDALDPRGILQVGKQGIWPARLRSNDQHLPPQFSSTGVHNS